MYYNSQKKIITRNYLEATPEYRKNKFCSQCRMRENYFNHDLPPLSPNISNHKKPCNAFMIDVKENLPLLTREFVWELHRKKIEIKEWKKKGKRRAKSRSKNKNKSISRSRSRRRSRSRNKSHKNIKKK